MTEQPMVYTKEDFHELGLEPTAWQEHLLYRSGMFMGPADHPDRKIQQIMAPAIKFIVDEILPMWQEAWDRLSEQIQQIGEVLEKRRGKPPKHGPPGRRLTPRVIRPTGHRRHHTRQNHSHGRRPREHQYKRPNTRAPPHTTNPRRST